MLEQFRRFLFDLDGVLYIGDEAQPYAKETIQLLRQNEKEIRFITNNPCTTRNSIAERLNALDIEAYREEVVTASSVTAQYIKENHLEPIYYLGDEWMLKELEEASVKISENDVAAVVVGWSDEITFRHIRIASRLIRNGASFIVTGNDYVFPLPDGPAPATGVISIALEKASGEQPIVIGKPYAPMFQEATKGLENLDECVMIGDNIHTDIKGAKNFGIKSVLKEHEMSHTYNDMLKTTIKPDLTIQHLKQLFTHSI